MSLQNEWDSAIPIKNQSLQSDWNKALPVKQVNDSLNKGASLNPSFQGAISALQGPTMNSLDELAGVGGGIMGSLANFIAPKIGFPEYADQKSFAQNYQETRDKVRGATEQYQKDYPATAITSQVLASLPTIAESAPAVVKGFLPKLLQGAKYGAGYGAAAGAGGSESNTPSGILSDTAQGAGLGGVLGGVLPIAGNLLGLLGKGIYHAVEPIFDSSAVKGRAYLSAAGDKASEIANLLKNNQESISGYQPTAGEAAVAAGQPSFSALQTQANKIASRPYMNRTDTNNAALLNEVSKVSNDSAFANPNISSLDAAQGVRAANAVQKYGAVQNDLISNLPPKIQEVLNRPSMKDAISSALKGAQETNGYFPDSKQPFSVGNLQRMKQALDDITSNPATFGLKATETSEIGKTRDAFVKFIEQASPGWKQARDQYAADSLPIDQMKTGQYLQDLVTPSGYKSGAGLPLKGNAFIDAVRKSTDVQDTNSAQRAAELISKKATGAPRYTELSQYMSPEQLKSIYAVRDNLVRSNMMENQAKLGGLNSPDISGIASQSVENTLGGKIPTLLSRPVMLANAIISRSEGKVNAELAKQMANEMLDPKTVGDAISTALSRKTKLDTIQQEYFSTPHNIPIVGSLLQQTLNSGGLLNTAIPYASQQGLLGR